MTRALLLVLCFVACPVAVQGQKAPNYCLGGSETFVCNFTHDLGHSVTSIAVSEALRLVPGHHSPTTRYLIGTIWFPIAHEIVDQFRWPGHSWRAALQDFVTYQAAWVVPLIQHKKYWAAIGVGVTVMGFIYWRYNRLSPIVIRIGL